MIMLAGLIALLPLSAQGEALKPVVEVEDVIYSFAPADNGAGPLWCYGSTCIVRDGHRVFASGLETLEGVKPLSNCRWMLFSRADKGWKLEQSDEKGRQREPCPLGLFSNGTLLLSTNPSLQLGEGGSPANPHILRFSTEHPNRPGAPLQPKWKGAPEFREHSYRALGVDGPNRELVLMNNLGYDQTHWSFMDRDGKWPNRGIIRFPIRGCYAQVALRDRVCHLMAIGDVVEPVEEWRKFKKETTGNDWDYVFRRLFYVRNPDVARAQFSETVEIDNLDSTSGYISNRDLWLDRTGAAHLLYTKTSVQSREMRDRFFPKAPIVTSLEYCIVRDGKVAVRRTLLRGGEGASPEAASGARFQATPDGRLFVMYYCGGADAKGKALNENRIIEILPGGKCTEPATVGLKEPFTTFMTATERGGSPPSDILDVLGSGGPRNEIRYARIRLQ